MGKNVLLLGAGLSTAALLNYLGENAEKENWKIRVGDMNLEHAKKIVGGKKEFELFKFDINNEQQSEDEIVKADIVISMLPASMHIKVARNCVKHKKSMVTASYISEEMKALDDEAKKARVVIMNEVGVDPGIDHMSAMNVINKIKSEDGKITHFETFTGGLVAPESDNNPWNYKFTWNPRNVVLAGSGGAVKFIQEGKYKYIPYQKVFRRTEIINIEDFGRFEGYANRDSLKYRSIYDLQDIATIYRGTLRRPGFCRAWNLFVQLGLTDDSYVIENSDQLTYRQYINLFLAYHPTDSVELKLMQYLGLQQDDNELFEKLKWLDLFEEIPIKLKNATPAQILLHILEQKWKMEKHDKDMVVMWHKFIYNDKSGKEKEKQSSLVVKGDDDIYTAMAKTVGLPVGIAAKMILTEKITTPGVHLPITPEIYKPILQELEGFGIRFLEKDMPEVTKS